MSSGSTPSCVDQLDLYEELVSWGHLDDHELDQGQIVAAEVPGAPSYEVVVSSWSLADYAPDVEHPEEPVLLPTGTKPASVVLKRADPALGDSSQPGGRLSLERELHFLDWAGASGLFDRWLIQPLPLRNPDPELVCSRFPHDSGARSLWRPGSFEDLVAGSSSLGEALATVHGATSDITANAPSLALHLSSRLPPALLLDRPTPDVLAFLSPARRQLLRLLQDPGLALGVGLAAYRQRWHSALLCVVHGGLEPRAVLMSPGAEDVRLVGWERVQIGDPSWDVGTVLARLLEPLVGASVDRQGSRRSAHPDVVAVHQQAAQSFLHCYVETRTVPETSDGILSAGLLAATVQLIAGVWHDARAALRLSPRQRYRLQLADNLLRDETCGRRLLRLDPLRDD